MEHPFFKDRLSQLGIETIIPDEADKDYIHASIFNGLTKGIFKDETKNKYIEIIDKLKSHGAEGVVFGSAEFSIPLNQTDCSIPIFDTTAIHSKAALTLHCPNEERAAANIALLLRKTNLGGWVSLCAAAAMLERLTGVIVAEE